jgi:hypothetical protein
MVNRVRRSSRQEENMTDHDQGDEPTPGEPQPSQPAATAALGDFSTGEGMTALGGMIVLAVWLIFEVITDDYSLSYLAIFLAAVAVILPRLSREKVEAFHPLSSLMKVVGYGLALVGVAEIISDVETGLFTDGSGLTIVAALAAYVGYVVAFMGARSIKT